MFGNFFPVSTGSIGSSNLSKCSKHKDTFLNCIITSDVVHKANCNIYLDDFLKCLRKNN